MIVTENKLIKPERADSTAATMTDADGAFHVLVDFAEALSDALSQLKIENGTVYETTAQKISKIQTSLGTTIESLSAHLQNNAAHFTEEERQKLSDPKNYDLPTMSKEVKGGAKLGSYLRIADEKLTVQEASTTQAGVVQLNDTFESESSTQAATARTVKKLSEDINKTDENVALHQKDTEAHITSSERKKWDRASTVTGGDAVASVDMLRQLIFTPMILSSGADLDSLTTSGRYYAPFDASVTNLPSGWKNGFFDVMYVGDYNVCKQVGWRHGTKGSNDYQSAVRLANMTDGAMVFGEWVITGKVSGGTDAPSGGQNGDVYVQY